MISQGALEEAILALLCFSTEHAPLLALKITEPSFFSNQTNRRIAEVALDYVRKYSSPPMAQIDYLLEVDYKRGEEGKLLRKEVELLGSIVSGLDSVFVFEQLDTFLETQKMTANLQKALEHLNQGELAEAKSAVYQATTLSPLVANSGLWMKDSSQALKFMDQEEDTEYFSSGVDTLDLMGARPERKTLLILIASAKKGKSWWLINVGKAGLQHHHKVLHITLEISDTKTARRYMQAIFGLTKSEAQSLQIPMFPRDEAGNMTINFHQLERESVLMKRQAIQSKLNAWWSCPDWVIKEFPTGTLTIEHLYLYIDSLKRERGFDPDLIIIDYPDLMKLDAALLRIETGLIYKGLRGIGVSRNAAIVGASQGNRESDDAKLVGKKHAAEDWSKVGTADGILTYSQTAEEYKLGLARIYTAAMRDCADQYITLISQAYPIGQFCVDSVMMNPDAITELQRVGAVAS